jgi:hypothetical protein
MNVNAAYQLRWKASIGQILGHWSEALIQLSSGDQITACHAQGTVGSPVAESVALSSRQRLAMPCMLLRQLQTISLSILNFYLFLV